MKDFRFLLFATFGALVLLTGGFALQRYRAENVLVTRVEIREIPGIGLTFTPGCKSSARQWVWRDEKARALLKKYVVAEGPINGFQPLFCNGYEIQAFSNHGRLWQHKLRFSHLTAPSEAYFLRLLKPG